MNRFIEHSQVVTTTKYNTVTDFHTRNHSTLSLLPLVFTTRSWQRIYNTGNIKVSLNHILPISHTKSSNHKLSLHRSTSQLFKLTACLLLLTPPAYNWLQTTFVVSYKPSVWTYRKHVTSFLRKVFIMPLPSCVLIKSVTILNVIQCVT
jgi:hypothetical protein